MQAEAEATKRLQEREKRKQMMLEKENSTMELPEEMQGEKFSHQAYDTLCVGSPAR